MRTLADRKGWSSPVTVRGQVGPRSFTVGDKHVIVRNRRHLSGPLPGQDLSKKVNVHNTRSSNAVENESKLRGSDSVVTRHGRIFKCPDRYGATYLSGHFLPVWTECDPSVIPSLLVGGGDVVYSFSCGIHSGGAHAASACVVCFNE